MNDMPQLTEQAERILGMIGFVLFAAFLLSLVWWASQPPSPGRANASQEQQQQAEAKTGSTGDAPQAGVPTVSPQEPIEAPPAQQPADSASEQNQQSTLDWWLTVASGLSNVAIALFTLVLAGVAIWQMRYMRSGLVETCKAADAAKKSADVAERSLHLSQRAYLSVGSWELRNLEPDKQGTVRFVIKNTGHTPAHLEHTKHVCRIRPSGHALPINREEGYSGLNTLNETNQAVNPGDQHERLVFLPKLDQARIDAIKNGSLKFWFLGYITFVTLKEAHIVRFAVVYTPEHQRLWVEQANGYNESD